MWLAIRLAVFVEPLSGFAPGSSVGGSVLGALVECLTLVPEHGEEGHLVSQGEDILTGMGIGRCSISQSCKGDLQVP